MNLGHDPILESLRLRVSIMNKRIHIVFASLCLLVSLSLPGCGSPAPATVSDPAQARATLRNALDSWKNGETVDALSKKSPVVYATDEDWQAGAKLESYTIEPNDKMFGTSLRCPVTLKIKDAKGRAVTREVAYVVMTTPVSRVDRQD